MKLSEICQSLECEHYGSYKARKGKNNDQVFHCCAKMDHTSDPLDKEDWADICDFNNLERWKGIPFYEHNKAEFVNCPYKYKLRLIIKMQENI